jgi:hypothetical protein
MHPLVFSPALMFRHFLPLIVVSWSVTSQAETSPTIPSAPAEAAKAFYTELRERKVEGLPKGQDWLALLPLVTEELATAILGAQAEQAEAIKSAPCEKPPWIEGDLFSSLFEGPQTFAVGLAKLTGDTAKVPVTCTHTEGGDTTKWTDTLLMRKTPKGWQLDDVRYGGTWDFASKGTLKQSLAPGVE